MVGCSGTTSKTPTVETPTVETPTPTATDPEVSIGAGTSPVTAGTPVEFVVSAAPAPEANVPVGVTVTESGSLLALSTSQTVTIEAGANAATLTVNTVDDPMSESESEVTATVQAGSGYTVGTEGVAVVTVADETPGETPTGGNVPTGPTSPRPAVTIAADTRSVAEGTPIAFTMQASPAPTTDLVATLSWSDPGGVLAAPGPDTMTTTTSTVPGSQSSA